MAEKPAPPLTSPISQEEFDALETKGDMSNFTATPDRVNALAAALNEPVEPAAEQPAPDLAEDELTVAPPVRMAAMDRPPTMEMVSQWKDVAQEQTEIQSEDVQSSIYDVKDENPDEYAKNKQIADRLGVSVAEVQADPKAAQDELRFQDNEYFQAIRRESPELADALASDRDFAAVAQDDIEELKGITGFFKATKKAYQRQSKQVDIANDIGQRVLWGGDDITDAELQQLEQARNEAVPDDFGYDGMLSSIWFANVEQVPIQLSTTGEGLKFATGGGAGGAAIGAGIGLLAGGAGALPGAVTGGIRGARAGYVAGGFKGAAELETGFALQEFALMRDEDGQRMNYQVAKTAAQAVGVINGSLEFIGEAAIIKNIPGINKILPDKLTGEAAKAAMRAEVKKALRDKTKREALIESGKKYAQGLTVETATEMVQEIVSIVVGGVAQDASGQTFQKTTLSEDAARVGEAGVQALESMVLLQAPGPAIGLRQDLNAIKEGQKVRQQIEGLAKATEASKTAKRAPDKVEALVAQAKKQGDIDSAYVPLDKFTEYFQSQGLDPNAVADELGITEQVKQAQESGGDIQIPVEVYVSRMIPSGQYKGLMNDTKFNAEGYTVNQAKDAMAEYEGRVQKEVERVREDIAKEDGERSVRAQIYDNALGRLTEIGMPEAEARNNAEVIAARYAAIGERSGLDPMQLYQDSAYTVRRSMPDSIDLKDEGRIRNLVNRLQGNEYTEATNDAGRAADAQAMMDLQRFAEQLGVDVKTTDVDAVVQAIRQAGAAPQTEGVILDQGFGIREQVKNFIDNFVNNESIKKEAKEDRETNIEVILGRDWDISDGDRESITKDVMEELGDSFWDGDPEDGDMSQDAIDREYELIQAARREEAEKISEVTGEIENFDDVLKHFPRKVSDAIQGILDDLGIENSNRRREYQGSQYISVELKKPYGDFEAGDTLQIRVANHYREGDWNSPDGMAHRSESEINIQPFDDEKGLERFFYFIYSQKEQELYQSIAGTEVNELGFYSKMARTLAQKMNGTGTPEQYTQQVEAFAKQGMFKPAELEWSGLREWLATAQDLGHTVDGKLTRQQVIDYLNKHGFRLDEVGEQVRGDEVIEDIRQSDFTDGESQLIEADPSYIDELARDHYFDDIHARMVAENNSLPEDQRETDEAIQEAADDAARDAAMESYLNDDYSYKTVYQLRKDGIDQDVEVRLHSAGVYDISIEGNYIDQVNDWPQAIRIITEKLKDYGVLIGDVAVPQFEEWTGEGGENYSFYRLTVPKLVGGTYRNRSHYSEENVVFHYRTKDRFIPVPEGESDAKYDTRGKKVLFIEEIQSDLHQAAYKRKAQGLQAYASLEDPDALKKARDEYLTHKGRLTDADDNETKVRKAFENDIADYKFSGTPMDKGTLSQGVYNALSRFVNGELGQDAVAIHNYVVNYVKQTFFDYQTWYFRRLPSTLIDYTGDAGQMVRQFEASWDLTVKMKKRQKAEPPDFKAYAKEYFDSEVKAWRDIIAMHDENPSLFDNEEKVTYAKAKQSIIAAEVARQRVYEIPLPDLIDERMVFDTLWDAYLKHADALLRARQEGHAEIQRGSEINNRIHALQDTLPYAPFATSYRQVALKRLLIKAAQGGYDAIAWTTGTQQNIRYNLSNFIDDVYAKKSGDKYEIEVGSGSERRAFIEAGAEPGDFGSLVLVSEDKMNDIFGKENADIIRQQVSENTDLEKRVRVDFEAGIEMGGEKKGNFYDGAMPQDFKAVAGKIDKDMKAELVPFDISEKGREIGKAWYAPLTDAAKAKIKEGLELFQRKPETLDKRGSYNPSTKVITLFEKADLSTLMHEMAHLWLDETKALAARPDVKAEFKQDWERIKEYLGVTDDTMPFTVEQHEKWARSFEAYLMEGKAPSVQLQGIFDTFAAWLRRIYRSVRSLNAPINDEIRGVFDRMLATDEEVKMMQSQAEMLADPAIMELLTVAEKTRYTDKLAKAQERAKSELMTKAMRQAERRRKTEYKEEADAVKREVIEAMKADPVYQAIEALTNGHFIDDPKNERGIPRMKISRDWFIENFGTPSNIEVQPSPTGKTFFVLKDGVKQSTFKTEQKAKDAAEAMRKAAGKVIPEGTPQHVRKALSRDGLDADAVADVLAPCAFQSGRQMVDTLMKAKPFKDFVAEQTERIMQERYPDLLDSASITEEALKSMHNELRAEAIQQEYEAIAKRSGDRPFTKEMAKDVAHRIMNSQKIRDLGGTHQYYTTGVRLARQVGAAIQRGDFEKAADLKKKQLVNHYLYRLTKDNEESVDVALRYLRKFQKSGTRENLSTDYLDQIDALLEGYDLRKASSRKLKGKRESLQDFLKRMEESGTPVDIPAEVIADAYRVSYKDMTVPDFMAMRDAIKQLDHLGRLKNKLLKSKDQREFDSVVTEMVSSMEAEVKADVEDLPLAPSLAQKFKAGLSKWHAEHWKPEFMFRFLDGYKDMGAVWRALFLPLAEAEAQENVMQAEYIRRLRDIFKDYERGDKKFLFLPNRIYIPEIGQAMTKDQIMSVALNMGNEYNSQALLDGNGYDWETQMAITSKLSEKDWEVVEKVWDLIDTLWPAASALEKRLTGMMPEKVEARVFENPLGKTMRGGYYPVSFDRGRSERAFSRGEKGDANAVFQNNFSRPMTKKGHLKERVGTGGIPISLDLSVVSNHIYNVIHDLTHREAAIDVLKLISDERVQEAIVRKAGRDAYRMLLPWLQRVVNEKRQFEPTLFRILGKLRANTSIVTMGWKVTTAIQQPLGLLTTADVIGARWAGHGLKAFYGTNADANPIANMKKQIERVNALSPFMQERSQTFDRDVRQALDRLYRDNSMVEDWRVSMFYLTQMVQSGVDYPTWLGAYAKGMQDFDGIEQQAVDYADMVVRTSQSASGAKDLAAVQNNGEAMRWFTMYYSYFSLVYNLASERIGQRRTGRISTAKLAASSLYLWFLPAILSAMLTNQAPEDDDEYAKWLAGLLISYPLQTMVGVRDIANAVFSPFDYRITPVEAALDSITKGFKGAFNDVLEGDEIRESTQKNIVYGIGYAAGLPSAQAWNMLDYLRDYFAGEKESFSLYEFLVKKQK